MLTWTRFLIRCGAWAALFFASFLFFSAMALVELSIAKEIVLIGFTVLFLTLSVSAVLLLSRGRGSLKDLLNTDKNGRS